VAAALALARPLLPHPQIPQAIAAALGQVAPKDRSSGVVELGLSQGVAGVAHVLQRLAVGNQREQAWDAAAAWGRLLLDRLDDGDRCAEPGFLNGTAGVALALVAMATDVAPLWDRALLLS
jgi:lantibiotic modifying enzyme